MSIARSVMVGILVVAAATGCAAAKYSDDAIAAAKRFWNTGSESAAISKLDDFVAITGREIPAIERATISWSRRILAIRDRVLARIRADDETTARTRTFVVGSTCDAFAASMNSPGGLSDDELTQILVSNWIGANMPSMDEVDPEGFSALIDGVVAEIDAAVADGDLSKSYLGIAQLFICKAAGG